MWEYKTPKTGVPLEVLQRKRGVGPQVHFFLGAEFVELRMFSNMEAIGGYMGG
jgi:hypothetical protein